ncbi:hypothetical protein KIH31_00030 [Paenarthrobacter sp. DKR-5]|uniref:hypothetical protein n=1 Tax=Paenarthrobacter sp. DKR-5 TaxID=2835535 RepID=UPI001BDD911B|nr:hypothetical protein [Paenarthrobacter sp. DKR-5]MBT1000977.1 hypothetical protein [Paenarthrobacter sp. DKR-5]
MTIPMNDVWTAAARLESLELVVDQAEQLLAETMRRALGAGLPLPQVARAAGLMPLEVLALTDLPAGTVHAAEMPAAERRQPTDLRTHREAKEAAAAMTQPALTASV